MKTILCFGDSNTWGCRPIVSMDRIERYGRDERWTGVLRCELGAGYELIEEGNGGRTTVWEDPIEGPKNGKQQLIPCLDSHQPLDLVILMLGTNDLKTRFGVPAYDIAESAGTLVDLILGHAYFAYGARTPQVLLIAPPPIVADDALPDFFCELFAGGAAKSRKFGRYYAEVARRRGCEFLDAGRIIVSSPVDGIHFEWQEHHTLGLAVAAKVREIFKEANG